MKYSSLFRVLLVAMLSASSASLVGCSSSKMTLNPQTPESEIVAKKEYVYQDFSTARNFYGPPLKSSAQPSTPLPAPTSSD